MYCYVEISLGFKDKLPSGNCQFSKTEFLLDIMTGYSQDITIKDRVSHANVT